MAVVTLNIPEELYEKLQRLAIDMERSLDECYLWALEDFVASERGELDSLLESERDVKAGRYVSNEEVVAWLGSLGTANPLPRPSSKIAERLAS